MDIDIIYSVTPGMCSMEVTMVSFNVFDAFIVLIAIEQSKVAFYLQCI